MLPGLTVEDIEQANERLNGAIYHTPIQLNYNLSEKYACNIYLKREDLQVVRSYKIRGAYNFLSSQTPESLAKGIVCASAGNHAQGVALSCSKLKIKGKIFMPITTPKQKIEQVKMFGKDCIELILMGDTFDDSYREAVQFCDNNDMLFLHPFNDFKVMGDFWKNQTVSIIHNENPKLESKQKIIEYLKSENNLGLLEGLSGVGMSLLDTIDAKNVNWKKCMMFN